ncbi:MAG: hypothetical protein ACRCW1_00550 [Anaerotignaceae bacterium]
MKNYIKINMFDGKGGFENVLVEKDFITGLTKAWLNYGYQLDRQAKENMEHNGVGKTAEVMTLTVKKTEGKKILKDLFIEYKHLTMGENNI